MLGRFVGSMFIGIVCAILTGLIGTMVVSWAMPWLPIPQVSFICAFIGFVGGFIAGLLGV